MGVKKDFRAVVAVDQHSQIHVMDCTKDCLDADLFPNGFYPDDNAIAALNFPHAVGLYHVRLKPWSHTDYYGEIDFGIDAYLIDELAKPEGLL